MPSAPLPKLHENLPVRIPLGLMDRLRARAREEERTLTAIVLRALRRELGDEREAE